METIEISRLIENTPDLETVEVLVGLSEGADAKKIDDYCGSDGTVLKESEFGICRVQLTIGCLRELRKGGDPWIDFIEPAAQDSEVSWNTEYDKQYNSQ